MFFVSVASKGLSCGVSLLFATLTLAGRSINVAAKGLKAMAEMDPERVGAGSVDGGQCGEEREMGNGIRRSARMGFDIHGRE
jgi:hypothetical protein